MENSYLNIISFIVITIIYYYCKPALTIDIISNQNNFNSYFKSKYIYLGIYILIVILVQFILNATIITSNCGGDITQNTGFAFLVTFIPWTLIFGALLLVLLVYPGFKSAFADVIGYFYVSSSANKVLVDLLINKDVNNVLVDDNNTQKSTSNGDNSNNYENKKKSLEEAADLIVKICGNTSILINQIVPGNFMKYWDTMKPLLKPSFFDANGELTSVGKSKQADLFKLTTSRDDVGEAMWFLYTGILLTSIVQLKISTTPCNLSPAVMQQNYQTYLQSQNATEAQNQKATTTTYTL